MIASALRPLMSALRLRSAQRRLNRRQLLKLLADANRYAKPQPPRARAQAGEAHRLSGRPLEEVSMDFF